MENAKENMGPVNDKDFGELDIMQSYIDYFRKRTSVYDIYDC
jgi:hypothetical protein